MKAVSLAIFVLVASGCVRVSGMLDKWDKLNKPKPTHIQYFDSRPSKPYVAEVGIDNQADIILALIALEGIAFLLIILYFVPWKKLNGKT